MKKLNFLFCGLALSMLVFFSCEKEEITSTKQSVAESVTQDELETKLLNSSNEALAHPNQLAAYPKLNNSFKLDGVSSIISVGVNPNLPSGYFHNRALDYIIERRSVVNPNNILGSVTELTKDYMNSMSELAISQEISDSYDLPPSEEAVENIANEIKRIHQIGFDNYITNESGLSNTAINLMNEMFNRVLENVDSNSTLGLSLLFTEFEARTILNFSLSNQEKNIILNGK